VDELCATDLRGILLPVILLIAAAACSGCSTQQTLAKAGDFGAASSGGEGEGVQSGSAGSGSFPPAGTVVNASQVFREDFSWVRFRHTESYNGKTTVSDYSTEGGAAVYDGQPVYHAKTTITMTMDRSVPRIFTGTRQRKTSSAAL
jgi:hypothetical protein